MRRLIIDLLQRVPILTGINQGTKMTDEQRNEVVTHLVRVCNQYKHLDNEKKVSVLEKGLMSDSDFYGLTPKKAHQYLSSYWMSLPSGVRNKLMGEKETEYNGVSPEKAQGYIEQWKKSLSKVEEKTVSRSSSERIYNEKREAVTIEQKVVDCPKCKNEDEDKVLCTHCMGYGQIKKTLI